MKEQLAQTLAMFVTSILTQPRRRLDTEEAAEPPLSQIVDVLQQVMCPHGTQKKLAISVLKSTVLTSTPSTFEFGFG